LRLRRRSALFHQRQSAEARGGLQRIWGIGGDIFIAGVMDLAGFEVPSILHYQPE
jgi:hypothetical protein